MINMPGNDADRADNVIPFPRKPSLNRKDFLRSRRHCQFNTAAATGAHTITKKMESGGDNIRVIRPGVFAFTINSGSRGIDSSGMSNIDKPNVRPARTYRVLPTTLASRTYLKSRYIRHISVAIKEGDIQRLKQLYGNESFQRLPASDKLAIANSVIGNIKALRLSSCFTEGLSDCFLEAFIQGLGKVSDFRNWVRYAGSELSIDTLEGLVLHDDVNDVIRLEATTLVLDCFP